jgi:hypothetical protein
MFIEVPSKSLVQKLRTPHRKRGETTPGAKYVPIPCLQIQRYRCDGNKKLSTHLVVAHLVLHLILPQQRIQLDHICILLDGMLARLPDLKGGGDEARTVASYSFVVPSKHNTSVRGFRFTSTTGGTGSDVEETAGMASWGVKVKFLTRGQVLPFIGTRRARPLGMERHRFREQKC